MRILVCVKQVTDPESITVTEAPGGCIVSEGELRMNRFDEFAVEAAVRIKESGAAAAVDVLTLGPAEAVAVIQRSVGMGADRGVHLLAAEGDASSPGAAARRIARFAKCRTYDLILTGSMSEDGMSGQVGPMIAGYLTRPCATQVISIMPDMARAAVAIQREVEGGVRERLFIRLPAVLAVQPGIHRPRYPSLSNLLRANRQKAETVEADEAETVPDPVRCIRAGLPPRTRSATVLSGTAEEKADRLLAILRAKAFLP